MTKTALITGASKGIGKAFAQVLAQEKYNLVIVARSEAQLQAIQQELSAKEGVKIDVLAYDLTQKDAAQRVFDEVTQRGITVDVLVNNAGFGDYGEFANSDWPKIEQMILLNVMALSHLTHLFLPGMIERDYAGQDFRPGILNVSSTAAFQPGPMMAVYFATKAYVLSFSEAISAETQNQGINVTVLCPGPTQSNFGQAANMDQMALLGDVTSDKLPSALEVARYGYDQHQKGKVVTVHGIINKFLTFAPRITPRTLLRNGVKLFMTPEAS